MNAETIAIIAEAAAMVFYAGMNWQMLHSHEKRIDRLEQNERETALEAASLKGEIA